MSPEESAAQEEQIAKLMAACLGLGPGTREKGDSPLFRSDPNQEEQISELLAACDDALAAGKSEAAVYDKEAPPELRASLEKEVAWCRLVRRLLPETQSLGSSSPNPASLPETPAALPLTHLGRFRILRELGRGGFGVVLLAFDPKLGREVAVKVPRPEAVLHPELRARFQHVYPG
jgi:hypothetical protein